MVQQHTWRALQVHYAAQGFTDAAVAAHEAARVPIEAVAKPVSHLRTYFGTGSSDAANSVKSDEEGHAMRPLLSTFQETQGQTTAQTRVGNDAPARR